MRIVFLSALNPNNINNWSGTLYYMYQNLKKVHEVEWIGENLYYEVYSFHLANFGEETPFVPETYAILFGKLLSERLTSQKYDLIFARDYFYIAYLKTNIPLIYTGDATFCLFDKYLNRTNKDFVKFADEIERKAILNSDMLLYSSQWARKSAIKDYNASPEKVFVVEFGANTDCPPASELPPAPGEVCHLLFIGKNWLYKGGEKALNAYRILKARGFRCDLTIVGSQPEDSVPLDPDIQVFPFLDKSQQADQEKFHALLAQSHFLILPTFFDCFGIVFCEASAYSVPSLATRVGGVSQVIKEGKNGFLFPINATPQDYADKIQTVFEDKTDYQRLRHTSRLEFERRLNWETWFKKVNKLIYKLTGTTPEKDADNFYIPTYVINMKERKDRKEHILKEFRGKKEFKLTFIEACKDPVGAVGLWKSIVKTIELAKKNNDTVIIICEDDHFFTENYSKKELLQHIMEAYSQEADVLSGGIGGFGTAVPVAKNRYWVDWFWCTQFIVVYEKFFDTILNYKFKANDTADGVISGLANTMTLYPFISMQKDFGYSDVTRENNETQGKITQHFETANQRLSLIHKVSDHFIYNP